MIRPGEMTALLAWSMLDGNYASNGLKVHFILTGCYFVVGTQWPDEKTGWFTKVYDSAEKAQAKAVKHIGLLELGGDTMSLGPVAMMVKDQSDVLARYVGKDALNATLDHLFDTAMSDGSAA